MRLSCTELQPKARPLRLSQTIALIPWYQLFNSLLFWQAVWFLYFQAELSGAEAIILYSVYDIATTVLEVPSGYFSDRIGRRATLLLSTVCYVMGCLALAMGGSFAAFALGQCLIGAGAAFKSGTDSSLLYEALEASGRADEVEAQELRAWRFTLAGFALSAVIGGAMSLYSATLPFYATALSYGIATLLVLRMAEPPRKTQTAPTLRSQAGELRAALVHPVLAWLFVLTVLMYAYSHLPFVFGQPFILTALDELGLAAEAPLVSGAVTSAMMLISGLASLVAVRLRAALGLPLLLLCAFGLQIALVAALAASTSVLVIGVLLLRIVPDSLAYPFILARIQPLLESSTRATYLSLKSLGGKVFFAVTLLLAATSAQDAGLLPAADLQRILGWYTIGGIACLALLALTARHIAIAPPQKTE
ncbi:MFS transporter [uncultured Sulfitobacter sp.]|uniref:MFS transporter n=1 Tax=uncultured Sulfitobacter sp. TaxID=191468 RepID=UPI00260FC7A5|nr:MFS transporter [uncultured Sulfitobacter sp.]